MVVQFKIFVITICRHKKVLGETSTTTTTKTRTIICIYLSVNVFKVTKDLLIYIEDCNVSFAETSEISYNFNLKLFSHDDITLLSCFY